MKNNAFLEEFNYYAFVSYSRKDIKIAKWVQKKLESYRLPAKIRKENSGIPKTLYPVFRDQTDLSGTELEEALKAELRASKYLIVICSPNSAKSFWVNKEIEYFRALGKEKFVIPFIIDGEPFSGNECYPEEIKQIYPSPLAINLREKGKRHSLLQLISTLLSIRLDSLVERDKKRRTKRNAAATLLTVFGLFVGGYALYYNTPHSRYYSDVVYNYEIPSGVYRLTKEEHEKRAHCYKVTTKRGEVILVETVNALNVPTNDLVLSESEYPIQEFKYDTSGKLISVSCFDEFRKILLIKNISAINSDNEIAIDLVIPSDATKASSLSSDVSLEVDSLSDRKSEITRMLNTYNSEGLIEKTLFQKNNLGTPACDANGIYGKIYEYNEAGQMISASNLNQQGEVFDCRYGWARVELEYNDIGLLANQQYKDKNNNNVYVNEFSLAKACYDENGNPISLSAYDENGNLCNNRKGCAMTNFEYSDTFLHIASKFYNSDNEAVCDEYGVHKYVFKWDSNGRMEGISFYDTSGNPTYSQNFNCFNYKVTLDSKGRVIQEELLDSNNKPLYDPESGSAITEIKYDSFGFANEVHYFDENHNPTMTKYGYASFLIERNSLGQTLREETKDAKGNLICANYNYAAAEYTYDTFGNIETISYFDENGKPCYNSDGYSIEKYEYENGNLVSVKYYDHEGKPTDNTDGYHSCVYKYENGNCTEYAYLDSNGQIIPPNKDFYPLIKLTYDSVGNNPETFFCSSHNNISVKVIRQYDKFGNVIKEDHYEETGTEEYSHSGYEMEYDIYSNLISQKVYSENKLEYQAHYQYDSKGNSVSTRYVDSNGNPYQPEDSSFINMHETAYDEYGKETSLKAYHLTGDSKNLLYHAATEYDSLGNLVFVKFYDENGNLFLHNGTTAAVRKTYNHKGDEIVCEYLDTNLAPTTHMYFSTIKYEYNAAGKTTKEIRLDSKGNLISSDTGVPAIITYEYDQKGRIVRTEHRDQNKNLYFYANSEAAVIEYTYDETGMRTVIDYDENGERIEKRIPVILMPEIHPGTVAEKLGICAYDIILVWGKWDYFSEAEKGSDFISTFSNELHATQNTEKKMVVARYGENGKFAIHEFMLPAGKTGVTIADDVLVESLVEEAKEAYNNYLKSGR